MATIELAHLSDHLEEHDVEAVQEAVLAEAGKSIDTSDHEESEILERNIDDDVFTDFRDRLEANDLDADIYVPVEFDDLIEVGEYRVASTQSLRVVLESLREDFFVEDEDEDEEDEIEEGEGDDEFEREIDEDDEAEEYYADEDEGIEMKDEQLRHIWRVVFRATRESINRNLPLFFHE